jgi:hypothetical protein
MKKLFLICLSILFLISCSSGDGNSTVSDLGTSNSIENDLTGKLSLFPLALNPEFTSVSKVNIDNNQLVGIVTFGSVIKVFPYNFIVHNEIVNDEYNGKKYAFSYCPITKSSLAFIREETFRASGLLYKDNLAPWDEKTETIWSQMLIKAIKGPKENIRFNTIPLVETTWKIVKDYFPNAKVVSGDLFSTKEEPGNNDNSNSENAPGSNELAYGILDDFNNIRIFKYSDFSDKSTINVTIQSQKYIVYGSSSKHIINAFKVSSFDDFTALNNNEFPFVLQHTNGTKYNVFGLGINGTTLEKPKYAYVAIWSAWQDFYPNFTFQ